VRGTGGPGSAIGTVTAGAAVTGVAKRRVAAGAAGAARAAGLTVGGAGRAVAAGTAVTAGAEEGPAAAAGATGAAVAAGGSGVAAGAALTAIAPQAGVAAGAAVGARGAAGTVLVEAVAAVAEQQPAALTIGGGSRAIGPVTDQPAGAGGGIRGAKRGGICLVKPIIDRSVNLLTKRAANPVLLKPLQPGIRRIGRCPRAGIEA
jgi:hypothetical protein